MEAKHTPGPWSIPHFARPEVNCECGYVLSDFYMGAVATVHCSGDENINDNPRFDEAVANARLIAAAPDLLEACQLALTAFATNAAIDWGVLEVAIAKARGETP